MDPWEEAKRFPKLFALAQDLVKSRVHDRFGCPLVDSWPGGQIKADNIGEILRLFMSTIGVLKINKMNIPDLPIGAPWQVPENDSPYSRNINLLLLLSLGCQKTGIYGTEFWESGVMSGDYLTVCGVLHLHFKSLGIPSEIKVGIRKIYDDRDVGVPVVWLEIFGNLIDNTYYHFANMEPGTFDTKMVDMNKAHRYIEDDPTTTKIRLVHGQGIRTCVNDPKVFKAYATPEHIGKYLWFKHGHGYAFPNYLLFLSAYIEGLMHIEFIADCEMPLPEPFGLEWNSKCWLCQKSSTDLKKCSVCLRAVYCDERCQKTDWSLHKLLHIDLKANNEFWRLAQLHISSLQG